MRKPARSSILERHRPLPIDSRYELVFERSSAGARVLTNLSAELRALVARGGTAIGDAYALAARAFLTGVERLEDLRAERHFELRAARAPAASRRTPARLKIAPRTK